MRKLVLVLVLALAVAIAAIPGVAQAAVISSWSLTANADDSAASNNGTATDVTFTGSAAVFNGTSSKISVPYNANLSPGPADVTASVDVNTTFMPGTDGLDFDLLRSAKGNPQYKIELYPRKGKAQAQCIFHGSVANTTLHKGPSLNDGAWHTIVCTKTPSQVSLTVDGKVVGTRAITIGAITHKSRTPFQIGYKPTSNCGADFYHGSIRNVSVSIG
jgi:Concanavalin A-like lectin/glucanases superfamily